MRIRITGLPNRYDRGGYLDAKGTSFPTGTTFINNGGTHEQNPNEGVQVGIDPQGVPNMVEEGEVIWNDYVFSNRLKVPKDFLKANKLGNKDLSFADVAEKFQEEIKERPNDPISKAGLDMQLSSLRSLQDEVKMKRELNKVKREMGKMPPEEQLAMLQGLQQQQSQQGGLEELRNLNNQMPQEQMMQDPSMQQKMIPQEGMPQGVMAYGGRVNKFAGTLGGSSQMQQEFDRLDPRRMSSIADRPFTIPEPETVTENPDLGLPYPQMLGRFNFTKYTPSPNYMLKDLARRNEGPVPIKNQGSLTPVVNNNTPVQTNYGLNRRQLRNYNDKLNQIYTESRRRGYTVNDNGTVTIGNNTFTPSGNYETDLNNFNDHGRSLYEQERYNAHVLAAQNKYINDYLKAHPEIQGPLNDAEREEILSEAGVDWGRGYVKDPQNYNNFSYSEDFRKSPESYLRYTPAAGNLFGLLFNLIKKPDYSYADRLRDLGLSYQQQKVDYNPTFMGYKPIDENYLFNQQVAANNAALSALNNSSNPSKQAAILAQGYNALDALAKSRQAADQYNYSRYKDATAHNDSVNRQKAVVEKENADLYNQYMNYRNGYLEKANQMRKDIDDARAAAIMANLNGLTTSLGQIGEEAWNGDWRDYLIRRGVYGNGTVQTEMDKKKKNKTSNNKNNKDNNNTEE